MKDKLKELLPLFLLIICLISYLISLLLALDELFMMIFAVFVLMYWNNIIY